MKQIRKIMVALTILFFGVFVFQVDFVNGYSSANGYHLDTYITDLTDYFSFGNIDDIQYLTITHVSLQPSSLPHNNTCLVDYLYDDDRQDIQPVLINPMLMVVPISSGQRVVRTFRKPTTLFQECFCLFSRPPPV